MFAIVSALGATASLGALYSGNGNTDFGGAVGNGSLTLHDDGTAISGTFTKGPSTSFNNDLVIYIDTKSGGFSSTASFTDTGDPLRKAISGYGYDYSTLKRSTATFVAGFAADYAIALGWNDTDGYFGGLWELKENASHDYKKSVNLANNGNDYTFSLLWADIGASSTLSFESTYVSSSGYRSGESFESITGTAGWNPFTFSTSHTYLTEVPEPTNVALAVFAGLALMVGGIRAGRKVVLARRTA